MILTSRMTMLELLQHDAFNVVTRVVGIRTEQDDNRLSISIAENFSDWASEDDARHVFLGILICEHLCETELDVPNDSLAHFQQKLRTLKKGFAIAADLDTSRLG